MTHPKADGLDALKREVSKSLELYHGDVARVIAHLAQRGMILQEGWVAVPREPTDAMCRAMRNEYVNMTFFAGNVWPPVFRAMLAAAPKMEGNE